MLAYEIWPPTAMPSVEDGEHRLFLGDNLRVLDQLVNSHEGTVDLIYIDPPFATGVDRKYVNRSANRSEDIAYGDIWDGDLTDYLAFMRERLIRLHRLLKPDGSLFLHCDYRASPNLALMCDELFGRGARRPGGTYAGFRNEIIWRYGLGGSSSRCYPHKHDVIFWYSRGETWKFTPPMVPATSQRMRGQMKKCPDVWDIPSLNNMAHERTGYPTQKPQALLERIIEAHSEPGDLVLDAFCGSGTTVAVAQRLGRRIIGIDQGPLSLHITRRRLLDQGLDRPLHISTLEPVDHIPASEVSCYLESSDADKWSVRLDTDASQAGESPELWAVEWNPAGESFCPDAYGRFTPREQPSIPMEEGGAESPRARVRFYGPSGNVSERLLDAGGVEAANLLEL